jgi:hypothetical protein
VSVPAGHPSTSTERQTWRRKTDVLAPAEQALVYRKTAVACLNCTELGPGSRRSQQCNQQPCSLPELCRRPVLNLNGNCVSDGTAHKPAVLYTLHLSRGSCQPLRAAVQTLVLTASAVHSKHTCTGAQSIRMPSSCAGKGKAMPALAAVVSLCRISLVKHQQQPSHVPQCITQVGRRQCFHTGYSDIAAEPRK